MKGDVHGVCRADKRARVFLSTEFFVKSFVANFHPIKVAVMMMLNIEVKEGQLQSLPCCNGERPVLETQITMENQQMEENTNLVCIRIIILRVVGSCYV